MINLVKKDFLSISKNKSILIEVLLMPFILIAILGFALGSVLLGDYSIEVFNVGIVNEQNLQADLNRFEIELKAQNYPEEVKNEFLYLADEINPAIMIGDVLEDESFEDVLVVNEFSDVNTAENAMLNDEIAGYIIFPEDFSYHLWESMLLEEDTTAEMDVVVNNEGALSANILQSVVTSIVSEYNLESSIAIAANGQTDMGTDMVNYGAVESLSVEEPVTAFQYYTIGMGVMFALSTAPLLAHRSFREKQLHVFGRIMLSGTKPLTYLLSKLISGTLITFVQLAILFVFSTLIFGTFSGQDSNFWLNLVYTTGIYSLLIGSLTSLLTSAALYANDDTTVGFVGMLNTVFAFLGGSFMPVEQFSKSLSEVGNWTPNGATMTSYLQLLQGFSFLEVLSLMARVIGLTVIFIVAALIIFPKRRLD